MTDTAQRKGLKEAMTHSKQIRRIVRRMRKKSGWAFVFGELEYEADRIIKSLGGK